MPGIPPYLRKIWTLLLFAIDFSSAAHRETMPGDK
jgi:hypothetical protein